MSNSCPSCQTPVQPQHQFCPDCGFRLHGSSVPPRQALGIHAAPLLRYAAGVPNTIGSLQAGMLLAGRYRLTQRIGHGNMGEVWEGSDERLRSRTCAVKQVLLTGPNPAEQAEREAWFAREAETLATLKHQHICDIRDVFEEHGNGYLILELVEGHTMAQELTSLGKPGLPEAAVLDWARQLGEALTYLHGQMPSIVFRDLKPQNIMLRPNGQLVLIDFGIARPAVTTGGTTIGTPGYAPPEQYQGFAEPRSDQYALAATLHHLLTGRNPEQGPPFAFPSPSNLVPGLSASVGVALARALAMRMEDRFASVDEFLAALSPSSAPKTIVQAGAQSAPITSPAKSSVPTGVSTSFGDGTWRVGIDIAPGTYRTPAPSEQGAFYMVLQNFTGTGDHWIAAGNVYGPDVVTIVPEAAGIRSWGCGTWTKVD